MVSNHVPKQPEDVAGKQKPQEQWRSVSPCVIMTHLVKQLLVFAALGAQSQLCSKPTLLSVNPFFLSGCR